MEDRDVATITDDNVATFFLEPGTRYELRVRSRFNGLTYKVRTFVEGRSWTRYDEQGVESPASNAVTACI